MFAFPDPRRIESGDVVAVGGSVNAESLLAAYAKGIFPWPQEGLPMLWFCPMQRGVIDFADLKISKSLRRSMQKPWRFSVNQAFETVINECASQKRTGQTGTWLSHEMISGYMALHQAGAAFSVETWLDDEIVGGLYGVDLGYAVSGESMFHKVNDASKVALVHLIELLRRRGLYYLDVQMITPHVERMGGKYIPKIEFLNRLDQKSKPFQSSR